MTRSRALFALVLLPVTLGCGSTTGNGYSLPVGSDDDGGSFVGSDAGGPMSLDAHFEENHVTVTFVTVSCAARCATVMAVPTGGNPPYSIAWDDGSTSAERQLCPTSDTSYGVKVSDTAVAGEVPRPSESVHLGLPASVFTCPDGGPTDAGSPCSPDAALVPPEDVTPDYLDNTVKYFGGGAPLPAGRYRLAYVSGCVKYNGYSNFTVNGQSTFEYWLVGASASDQLYVAPGTVAPGIPFGYPVLSDCVSANQALPPLDFDFAGGPLGMYNNDFQPSDNVIDPTGGAPTWRLSGACP
jgi:hypothetical protein